jgi:RNA recognition motif-containing protein
MSGPPGQGENQQMAPPPEHMPPPGYPYPPPPGYGAPMGFPPAPGYYPGMQYYPPPVAEKLREREKLPKNNTLYIKNLNSRIKIEYLRQSLENVFTQYGKLADVKVKRNFRMRGQAFLVFDEEDSAEKALYAMDGAIFYQKPLMINYARSVSDVISKRKGEYSEEAKAKREENNKKFGDWVQYIRNLRAQEKLNKLKNEQNELMAQNDRKGEDMQGYGDMPPPPGYSGGDLPSNSLYIQAIPHYMNQISLHGIFSHYPGFIELRLSPTKESATIIYKAQPEAHGALMGK